MKRKHWSTPLTFYGAAGVRVRASALLARRPLSKTYRVQQIAFEGGVVPSTEEQRAVSAALRKYVESLVGKTTIEWAAAALASSIRPISVAGPKKAANRQGGVVPFVNTDFSAIEKRIAAGWHSRCAGRRAVTVDYPGCTTKEQAEALASADYSNIEARILAHMASGHRTPSNTLSRVMREMRDREQFGLGKYGTTVDRTDLSVKQWLQHAKEEAMDSVLYLDRLIQEEEAREADPYFKFAGSVFGSTRVPGPSSNIPRETRCPPELGMPYGAAIDREDAKRLKEAFHKRHPRLRAVWARRCAVDTTGWLERIRHNTAVNLTGIWTEAFGHPVTDVRTPLGFEPCKVAPPTDSFFDTRLSA